MNEASKAGPVQMAPETVETMTYGAILSRTYTWLLEQYGCRSNIRIDLSEGERVKIYVSQQEGGHEVPYVNKSRDQFMDWFKYNVLEE